MKPRSAFEWVLEVASIVLLLGQFALILAYSPLLPDQIAIHFDFQGNANGWGSKSILWILPLVSVSSWMIMTAVGNWAGDSDFLNLPGKVDRKNPEVLRLVREMLTLAKCWSSALIAELVWMQIRFALGRGAFFSIGPLLGWIAVFLLIVFVYSRRMVRVSGPMLPPR